MERNSTATNGTETAYERSLTLLENDFQAFDAWLRGDYPRLLTRALVLVGNTSSIFEILLEVTRLWEPDEDAVE